MSLELHNLKTKGKNKQRRKARGISAGQGRTAGRGKDGQKSRTGYSFRVGFEGGQNPLYRRVAKRGFTNFSRVEYSVVSVEKLNTFEDNKVVQRNDLLEAGILPKKKRPVKILGDGELTKKLEVHADKFSKTALSKIEAAGGKAVTIEKEEAKK